MKTTYQRVNGKTIEHKDQLTSFESKMHKLRKWLLDNHGVLSFTKLKQRGPKLIEIRKKGLAHAGFKN